MRVAVRLTCSDSRPAAHRSGSRLPMRPSASAKASVKSRNSAARRVARGEEQLLALDLVGGDSSAPRRRGQPFVPAPRLGGFHVREFLWIDENAAIGVEQCRIALDENLKRLAVGEIRPSGAVGERVGIEPGGRVERRTHAGAELAIPPAAGAYDVDIGRFPKPQFETVRAALVAA